VADPERSEPEEPDPGKIEPEWTEKGILDMSHIMTVRGPIPPEDLGFASMHEHILLDASAMRHRAIAMLGEDPNPLVDPDAKVSIENLGYHRHDITLTWDNLVMDDETLLAGEIADFKASGGSAIAEMSPTGLRNNVAGLKRISEETGVHIITPTGLYAEYTWPERFAAMSIEDYTSFMLKEFEEGIDGTDIKPGHIKFAVEDNDVSPQEEKMLRAAVRVSRETGMSGTFHSGILFTQEGVRNIVKTILDEGINPERALLCHMQMFLQNMNMEALVLDPDSCGPNMDMLKEILDQGFNICFDCFGHNWDLEALGLFPCTDLHRIAGIIELVKAGYASQIVIGTDLFVKIHTRRYGGESYSRLTNFVKPTLEKLGVSEKDVRLITEENPARILAF
jgi:phosphotriesterase-related protein